MSNSNGVNDKEFHRAQKMIDTMRLKKEAKTARKVEQAINRPAQKGQYDKKGTSSENALKPIIEKNFATQTIWGANMINCRTFNIDGIKNFDFLASFTTLKSVPIWPLPEIAFLGRSNVGKSSMLNTLTGTICNVNRY